ncbi:MAG TPA: hypothetical protein VHQ66_08355 [Myxococcota bacterium]|nr:hypothetical protein [Myxococcota bacterium]
MLRELPAAALVALACTQIALAFGAGLSPWKGGGFGMFATNDHGGFRHVRVYALEAGGERRLDVPPELQRQELHAAWLPTDAQLRRLAAQLSRTGVARDAGALRVEVWRTEFDASLRPTPVRIAALTSEPAR